MRASTIDLRSFLKAATHIGLEGHTPWFFRLRRYVRRCRRGLFGPRTPHWVSGAYTLLRWFNFVEVIPTFAVLLIKPWHFYRRLPQILDQKKPWFKPPLPFLATQVIYALLFVKYLGMDGGALYQHPNVYFSIIVISSPLWMLLLALCMYPLASYWQFSREVSIRKYKCLYFELFVVLNPALYLIPLDRKTYSQMRWGRFFWDFSILV